MKCCEYGNVVLVIKWIDSLNIIRAYFGIFNAFLLVKRSSNHFDCRVDFCNTYFTKSMKRTVLNKLIPKSFFFYKLMMLVVFVVVFADKNQVLRIVGKIIFVCNSLWNYPLFNSTTQHCFFHFVGCSVCLHSLSGLPSCRCLCHSNLSLRRSPKSLNCCDTPPLFDVEIV